MTISDDLADLPVWQRCSSRFAAWCIWVWRSTPLIGSLPGSHISTARLVSSIVAWLGWVGLSYFRLHEKSTELHFLCATAFFFGCLVHYALAGFDVVKAGAGKLVGLLDLLVLCASLYCIWVWRINGDPMGEWRAARRH